MTLRKKLEYVADIAKTFLHRKDKSNGLSMNDSIVSDEKFFEKRTGISVSESQSIGKQNTANRSISTARLAEDSGSGKADWVAEELSLTRRVYEAYEDYVEHQKSKLSKIDLTKYDEQYRLVLAERLSHLKLLQRGDSVLCVAARLGTECKAFIDLGCFAVGIDLNPGLENKYVVHGDFHDIQFAEESIDYVFTNALDHAFELDKVIREIQRVLKQEGVLIAEIVGGSLDEHGRDPGFYESVWWGKTDDVIEKIKQEGFDVEHNEPFSYPWQGRQVVFRKV